MSPRVRRSVAALHPGAAAAVMATGIVSTGFGTLGRTLLSRILLVVALVTGGVLAVGYVWRLVAFPRRMLVDLRDPARGFGFFTLVAAPNVLGMRLALGHHVAAAMVFGWGSVPVWVVLTYVVPGAMVVGRRREPVLRRSDGSWFLWVVGTQSLAAAAAVVAAAEPRLVPGLAPAAVALWGVGVVWYVILAVLLALRLLNRPVAPRALSPSYWVYMGATAIIVLAAAQIVAMPGAPPVLAETRLLVSGLAFLLWAFGTWWIPLLLIALIWRYAVRRVPLRYEPALWSVVFPLGMYATASADFGRATGMGFMVAIARAEIWFALAAWLAVVATVGVAAARPPNAAVSGCEVP